MRKFLFIIFALTLLSVGVVSATTTFEKIDIARNNLLISQEDAIYYKLLALRCPSRLPAYLIGDTKGREGTAFVQRVMEELDGYSPELRSRIKGLLDRPAGLTRTYNSSGGHFKIHYTTTGADRVPSTEYVHNMGGYLERAYSLIVDTLDYFPPVSDGEAGGDDRTDVYLVDMEDYGVTYIESPGDAEWSDYSAYILIENDFAGFPDNDDPEGRQAGASKVTAAHEFFHTVQAAYDGWERTWWMEMCSVWLEERAYPYVNDYYHYLDFLFDYPQKSLFTSDGEHEYGTAIFNIFNEKKHGIDIIKEIWENCRYETAEEALASSYEAHGSNLPDEVVDFCIWNYFTRVYADPERFYPDGADYPGIRMERTHTVYPVSGMTTVHQPEYLGANYINLRNPIPYVGTFQFSFSGISTVSWKIALIKRDLSGIYSFEYYDVPSSGNTLITVDGFENYYQIIAIIIPITGRLTGYSYTYAATIGSTEFPPPSNLRGISGRDSMVPLFWTEPSGATPDAYRIYRRIEGLDSFSPIDETPLTHYYDSDVVNDTRYQYVVTALYDSNESGYSNIVTAIPAIGEVVLDTFDIFYDDGVASTYLGSWDSGDIIATRFVADDTIYQYRIVGVSADMYDFAYTGSAHIKAVFYSVGEDTMPDELIAESDPVHTTAFHPELASIDVSELELSLPYNMGIIVGIEYVSGEIGSIPAILIDDQNGVPHYTNYYCYRGTWREHYTFWATPEMTGYNIIRLTVEQYVGIDEEQNTTPNTVSIDAFPNPFNNLSKIRINLPHPADITISIYNLLGEKIDELFSGRKDRGSHIFLWDASNLSTGIYLYRVEAGNEISAGKLILIK